MFDATSAADAATAWAIAHPDEMDWLMTNMEGNPFAASLAQRLNDTGALTARQEEALIEKVRGLRARGDAPTINIGEIEERFDYARARGVKKPALRLDEFTFKAAGQDSRNAGGIYVTIKRAGEPLYLGKIMGGKFLRSRDCTDEQVDRIAIVASNPSEAAKAYGQRTGNCSVCGRELTAEESIERFIGPICAQKFGFGQ